MGILFPFLFLLSGHPPGYQIRTFADDGAWLWFNDQNIIVDGNTLYMGCENSEGYSAVDIFQDDGKEGRKVQYILSSEPAKDDHNYPALLKLANGKLMATYSRNPSPAMYCRIASVSSEKKRQGSLDWGQETSIALQHRMSYNNTIMLSGERNRIYNWYSIFTGSPSFITSDDQGVSWSDDASYMNAGKNHSSPYLKYCTDSKKRVDILYTDGHPRNEANNNIYHIYYLEGKLFTSDGKLIRSLDSSVADPISPALGTKIYDGSQAGPGWVWDIEYDRRQRPVAAFISSADLAEGNDLRYRYATWNDEKKQWKEQQIAYAGTHLYVPENHFAGGITIDPNDVNVVYLSSNTDPCSGKSGSNRHYQIYQGRTSDGGATWKWMQLTFDTDQDNLRPIVPRNHHARMCVLWFQGEYKSSVNFKTKVVGIFER